MLICFPTLLHLSLVLGAALQGWKFWPSICVWAQSDTWGNTVHVPARRARLICTSLRAAPVLHTCREICEGFHGILPATGGKRAEWKHDMIFKSFRQHCPGLMSACPDTLLCWGGHYGLVEKSQTCEDLSCGQLVKMQQSRWVSAWMNKARVPASALEKLFPVLIPSVG